ncbi:GIY-YIG nuclease superfamily [Jimgerdemannia flammicorona]|uniref:GIY-YIG nuclease superfamily n=2 Tax=Jimgerdemannia flammicorona TaxID=994334 RepID=A0A433QF76_9FUNG|nr:GIY-YIG nuclease superfamily [Jimgerdemannia flammicorona]RUS28480.1 GIY-YIG nuclease superfamily [Jimgerdemannia flammicorona]
MRRSLQNLFNRGSSDPSSSNSSSSNSSSNSTSSNSSSPVVVYGNADIMKQRILSENKGKSGIYLWRNLITGDTYVGRSSDLSRRLQQYFQFSYLSHPDRGKSLICNALLHYGYSNFALEVLEYCDTTDLVSREQYYLNTLAPIYNILKDAGSSLDYKHTAVKSLG